MDVSFEQMGEEALRQVAEAFGRDKRREGGSLILRRSWPQGWQLIVQGPVSAATLAFRARTLKSVTAR